MERTTEQKRAIETRNTNLLVSAAAGAGKTTVLIARIMDLMIREHIPIDSMLIVTFTNDAASVMRSRLQKALIEAVEKSEPSDAMFLSKQIDLVSHADISTMHKFCIRLLQRYYALANLPASFRVGDEQTIYQLCEDVTRRIIEEKYLEPTASFLELTDLFSRTTGDAPLIEMLQSVYEATRNHPQPRTYLFEARNLFSSWRAEDPDHPWNEESRHAFLSRYEDAAQILRRLLKRAERDAELEHLTATFEKDLALVEERIGQYTADPAGFLTLAIEGRLAGFSKLVSKRGLSEGATARKKVLTGARDKAKKLVTETDGKIALLYDREAREKMQQAKRLIDEIILITSQMEESIHDEMLHRGILDFNALEHCAIEALENGADAYLSDRYEAIFFDEYQDANPVQEYIISEIMRKDNLFLVGDVKQSIYGFRSADPQLFLQKSRDWGEGAGGQRIDLIQNFRSKETVLSAVNSIFSRIMHASRYSVEYDEHAALVAGSEKQKGGSTAKLYVLDRKTPEDAEDMLEILKADEREAQTVASIVKDLLVNGTVEDGDGKPRRIQKKDIAILVRSASNSAESLSYALEQEGIECLAQMSSRHFDTPEVSAIISLLSVLDNPYQDVEMIAVLRSPFFLYDLNELARIRAGYKSGSFYEAMQYYAQANTDELAVRLAAAIRKLSSWRLRSRVMTVQQIVEYILADSGYEDMLLASALGRQKHSNIRLLLSRIAQLQDGTLDGIPEFLTYVRRVRKDDKDREEASTQEEEADAVRIMTVHKSKGMEFPVVIVAMLGRRFHTSGMSRVLTEPDLGIGIKLNNASYKQEDNPATFAINAMQSEKELMEEQRILYVAMTRAMQILIMTGSVNGGLEYYRTRIEAKPVCPLDWVAPCAVNANRMAQRNGEDAIWQIITETADSGRAQEDAGRIEEVQEETPVLSQEIRSAFEWTYPYADDTNLLTKTTVSRLKQRRAPTDQQMLEEEVEVSLPLPKRPEYYGNNMGARKGTATHAAVQHLDFASCDSAAQVTEQIDAMVKEEILSEEDRNLIDDGKVFHLAKSDLGKSFARKQTEGKLNRETPFTLSDENGMLIQGVIDAWYDTDEGIVLVDFKTDAIREDVRELAARYRVQLDWYEKALKRLTGRNVAQKLIYSFAADEILEL